MLHPVRSQRCPPRRSAILLGALAVPFAAALACAATDSGAEASAARGLEAFKTVQAVLQHPRCMNCHPVGDRPLQFDDSRPHGQLVARGTDGKGVPGLHCHTCHGTSNPPASYGPHQPPGAPNWHLPPAATPMVFQGKSAAELARTLADPSSNGGRSLQAMLEHVRSDPLVLWGWDPGLGREPVPVPHDEFVAAFATWVEAGAPSGR
jgi:hypothetical protein